MSIFLKHIFRNIREKKGRTFLILMSLFGVSLLTSIAFGVALSFGELLNSFLASSGNYDFEVRSFTEERLTIDRIESIGYDFDYLAVPEYNYGYLKVKDKYISMPLAGVDLNSLIKMNFIDVGDKKLKLNDNEVIISENYAKKYKIKKNSKIDYYDENGVIHTLKVAMITNGEIGLFQYGVSLITNENTYLSIIGKEEIDYDVFYLDYSGKDEIELVESELYEKESNYGLSFTYNGEEIKYVFDNLILPYIKIGVVAVLFLLVVVYFSINSVVKIIMNERIPVIGTFRSIGASKKNMNMILIAEMGMYGLIGGILGSGLGTLFLKLVYVLFEFVIKEMGMKFTSDTLSKNMLLVFGASLVFIILFQVSLSIFSIIQAGNKSIKECIFNKNETVHKYSKEKLFVGITFFVIGIISLLFGNRLSFSHGIISIVSLFISLAILLPDISKKVLSYFNKKNNPVFDMAKSTVVNNQLQISTNIIVGVMLCISLVAFSVLNVTLVSIKNKLNLVKSELYVETYDKDYDEQYKLSSIDGVSNVASLYYDNLMSYGFYDKIKFANNEVKAFYLIYSDDYKTLLENSNIIDVDYKIADKLKNDEIIISEYFKDKYNLKVGDVVVLNCDFNDKYVNISNPYNFKIVGFADTSVVNNMSILVSEDFINDFDDKLYEDRYFINLDEGVDSKKVIKEIEAILSEDLITDDNSTNSYTKAEYLESVKDSIKSNYKAIVMVLLIIVAVSLIGIINNQSVSFLQRKKEFAILYSTAMSKKQINKLMVFELFLSFVITSIVAFGLTIFILNLLNHIIEVLGFNLVLSFSFMGIFVVLFVVGIIMLCIYLVMRRKIRKMNVVEELKYE